MFFDGDGAGSGVLKRKTTSHFYSTVFFESYIIINVNSYKYYCYFRGKENKCVIPGKIIKLTL